MKLFSPTAFGSLHLAFNLDKSQPIPQNFVGTLTSSPSSDRFIKLHFYIHGFEDPLILDKIMNSNHLEDQNYEKPRPWCENLLPFIENPNHPDVIESNCEMVFVKDRFPKGSSHFLCLPRKRIDTWWHLKFEDIPLLKRMQKEAESFSQRTITTSASDQKLEFKFGFHVIPSMK